jgi:hypothetical protein
VKLLTPPPGGRGMSVGEKLGGRVPFDIVNGTRSRTTSEMRLQESQMVGMPGLQRIHQHFKVRKSP